MPPSLQNNPVTGAAYIRVSTNDQLDLSPDSQLKEIKRYAAEHSIIVPEEYIFMEKEGRSGKSARNRPAFQRMIATAKTCPRPFSVILVWKFSRFARNQDESTFYKGMLRKKLKIDIVSVSEPVLDGMYGRLIEMIIEWQDEFYSCNLSTEVKRGMEEKARGGGCQAALPYGYRHSGPGSIPDVIEKQAEAVRFMFSCFTEHGMTPGEIAKLLNQKGYVSKKGNPFEGRTVAYILKNPFYTGVTVWNRHPRSSEKTFHDVITAKGLHQSIITVECFEQAAARFEAKGPTVYRRPGGGHYLSGLLKCAVCGGSLSYSKSSSPCFQCWRYAKGLHPGSVYLPERRAVDALFTSLTEHRLFSVIKNLKEDSMTTEEKHILLSGLLTEIIYDRSSKSFHFHYCKEAHHTDS